MAELNIRLLIDPKTGKKNIIVEYESDSDALPLEHEDEHRVLIDKLIEGGVVKAEEIGKIELRREVGQSESAPAGAEKRVTTVESETEGERESVEQKS